MLARRKPSRTFTYGLGRAEDLAGLTIVSSWTFIQVIFAQHYAHEYFIERASKAKPSNMPPPICVFRSCGTAGCAGSRAPSARPR